ncbi:hypothetical protein PHISP_01920 [Aspergillus sp. HF37]|nr:hypothetical protein PHISP_01920 [Aspergillus sp. HF37]
MGKGRRMQKQGPPAPLDETKLSTLKKRKAGDVDSKADSGKKRRRAGGDDEAIPKKKANGAGNANGKGKNGSNATAAKEEKPKKSKPAQKSQPLESDNKEGMSDEDNEEMVDDEFGDVDGVSDGSMGSQDEGDSWEEVDGEDDSVLDSDEDHPRKVMFSDDDDDDDDDSDAEEKLTAANMEGLSKKLDEAKEAEDEEAQRELQETAMQTNIAGDRTDVFADAQGTSQPGLTPDLQLLRSRITDTIRILGDLQTLGQPGKSRSDYTDLLVNDICTYYGYIPFLAEKLFNLFTPMEAFAFFEANETPRPVVIRTNTLRTNRRSLAQALINRGVVLEPVGKWSKVGLQVFESAVPLGATPEYLAGHYILQAASSFLPVMALAPQPHERILDMASAPGGKTTYISALMRNTGCVIANDASKPRAKGLIGNIHRLGCKNTVVTNLDAREAFPKALGGFDRVLLDAPCTGTGVISKDSSVKTSKNERDFLAIPHMQRQLLLAAVDSVNHSSKTGGYVVYSTCSVTVEENEAVVQYILRKRPDVKIVDTGMGDFGSEGFTSYMGKQFDPKMTLARRYFPHRENVDGFFVCKLKKTGPSPPSKKDTDAAPIPTTEAPSNAAVTAVDRTPITDEDGTTMELEGGAFGGFDEEEDAGIIARAERNRIRRKGLNPKSVLNKSKKSKDLKPATSEQNEDAKSEENQNQNKRLRNRSRRRRRRRRKRTRPPTKSSFSPVKSVFRFQAKASSVWLGGAFAFL